MESLRDELLALSGVADAEIDEAGDTLSGVKIRLTADADADVVGAEVSRIFAAHGMRSRLASDSEPDLAPVASPPAADPAPPPIPTSPPPTRSTTASAMPPSEMPDVLIKESDSGVEVIVESGGRSARRSVGPTRSEMVTGAIEAMAELMGGTVSVLDTAELGGGEAAAIAVLVSRDGKAGAGAAMVGLTDAYAAAKAVWSALS